MPATNCNKYFLLSVQLFISLLAALLVSGARVPYQIHPSQVLTPIAVLVSLVFIPWYFVSLAKNHEDSVVRRANVERYTIFVLFFLWLLNAACFQWIDGVYCTGMECALTYFTQTTLWTTACVSSFSTLMVAWNRPTRSPIQLETTPSEEGHETA